MDIAKEISKSLADRMVIARVRPLDFCKGEGVLAC